MSDLTERLKRLKADVLHYKGMTKGRESEIDKHLATIERLRGALEAAQNLVTAYSFKIPEPNCTGEMQLVQKRDALLRLIQALKENDGE